MKDDKKQNMENKPNKNENTGKNAGTNNQSKNHNGSTVNTNKKPVSEKDVKSKQTIKTSASNKQRTSPVNDFVDRLRDDKKFAAIVGGCILAVVVIIILLIVFIRKPDEQKTDENGEISENVVNENTESAEGVVSDNTVSDSADTAETEQTGTDSSASPTDMVNSLITTYFDALTSGDTETIKAIKNQSDEEELLKIEKKSAYIESFENVNVYTKPGPVDNSYVSFVYYEMKFVNINTLAPGLITLYISAGEDGNLCIYDGQLDEQLDESVTDYIKELAVTDEIAALFDKVKVKYNEAVDSDADLKSFIEGLSDRLEAEVAAVMAQQQEASSETTEETTEPAAETKSQTSETVVATDTVNVRSSDSENADKLGKLEVGTKVTRYESKENGWSKIDYNGQEAYVKSEYLKVDDGTAVSQAQNAQTEESSQSDSSSSGEKVRVKETVKIRKSANTDGEVLATAYPGESFELVMKQADGWTKIKYNGSNAYIKSEYLE